MLNKTGIFGNAWVDLVFEGRNHNYGAFLIRKEGPRYTALAMLFTILFFGLLLSYPLLFPPSKNHIVADPIITEPYVMTMVDIFDPPPPKGPEPLTETNPKKNNSNSLPIVVKNGEEDEEKTEKPEEKESKTTEGESKSGAEKEGNDKSKLPGTGTGVIPVETKDYFDFVEVLPEFPGGAAALKSFLRKNIVYPMRAAEEEIEGKVKLSFIVERDGSISNVEVISAPIGYGLEEEAIRVVKILPRFRPGMQNGNPVRVRFMLPVVYGVKR